MRANALLERLLEMLIVASYILNVNRFCQIAFKEVIPCTLSLTVYETANFPHTFENTENNQSFKFLLIDKKWYFTTILLLRLSIFVYYFYFHINNNGSYLSVYDGPSINV